MCGIAGFISFENRLERDAAARRLNDMLRPMRHRGPDHEAVWTDGACGLAHARLAIIDLTPSGNQPMTTHDGALWIVFNGEIYNFREIRAELEAKGACFKSSSDTEVILEGYRAWGDAIIDRLRGMFSFALWDPARQRLLLARDRVGKKPLYWAVTRDGFVFGSEMKAFLDWPGLDLQPDLRAIDEYLSLLYIPAPRTAFVGVSKLAAAHKLVVERGSDGWRVGKPERYWRLPPPTLAATDDIDTRALEVELVERLREAVRLRLISDVPLGAFLSGGVDSSSVVAMMAELSSGPVKTFSIGFPYKEYDETRYARMVAERCGTDHEELILEPDAASILPKLVWHYNEPFADPSMIPTYYVSELARRSVTVALNGDGGDEAFFGYARYELMRKLKVIEAVPPSLAPAAEVLTRLAAELPLGQRGRERLRNAAYHLHERTGPKSRLYAFAIAYFLDRDKREGYGPAMRGLLDRSALDLLEPYFEEAGDLVAGAAWADMHTYLPDDLMVKVDVASMAASLEARSPLLDHRFLEWAAALPVSVKAPGGVGKGLFKKAMEPYLPRELLYRPKMGFGAPIEHWFRGDLREMAHDVMLSKSAAERGIIEPSYAARLLSEHADGAQRHDTRILALLNLELWFRQWSDQPAELTRSQPGGYAALVAVSSVAGASL